MTLWQNRSNQFTQTGSITLDWQLSSHDSDAEFCWGYRNVSTLNLTIKLCHQILVLGWNRLLYQVAVSCYSCNILINAGLAFRHSIVSFYIVSETGFSLILSYWTFFLVQIYSDMFYLFVQYFQINLRCSIFDFVRRKPSWNSVKWFHFKQDTLDIWSLLFHCNLNKVHNFYRPPISSTKSSCGFTKTWGRSLVFSPAHYFALFTSHNIDTDTEVLKCHFLFCLKLTERIFFNEKKKVNCTPLLFFSTKCKH